MRRYILWIITFAGGLFFLLEFLLPASLPVGRSVVKNPLTPWLGDVVNFLVVVSTMAFLLGPINLLRANLATLIRRRKGWVESLTFLVFLVASILAMTLKDQAGRDFLAGIPGMNLLAETGRWAMERMYNGLFYGLLTAFFASSMALLAFYLVSAAHRAFRMSTLEAGLMLGAAAIILLGQVPVGDWLTGGLHESMQFSTWTQWILSVPNTGVQRGVAIGACGGAFAAGMRQWLSLGKKAE
jgi:hypothetical protein